MCRSDPRQGHDAIDQTMNDFKTRRGSGIDSTDATHIFGTHDSLTNLVLIVRQDDITNFKQFKTIRKTRRLVVIQRL